MTSNYALHGYLVHTYRLRRAQAMEKWRFQRFVKVLNNDKGLTRKLFQLFAIRLQDDHSVLSLFARSEGTNYGTTQRVMILHLYLIMVMAVSALFYGTEDNDQPFGDTINAICASIGASIPVFTIRYIFQYSRPKETKEFVEWENKLLAKKLIALRKQNYYRTKTVKPKQKGRLDLTIPHNVDTEEQDEESENTEAQRQANRFKVELPIPEALPEDDNESKLTPSGPSPIVKTPSLIVPTSGGADGTGSSFGAHVKAATIGHSHKSTHMRHLTHDFEIEELSESEQNRIMENIFNLEDEARASLITPQPNFVVMQNQNLHHRVQSVLRRHLSMFVNPEMHKSLLDEVYAENDDGGKEEEEDPEDEDMDGDNAVTPDTEDEDNDKVAIDINPSNDFLGVDVSKLFNAEEDTGKNFDIMIFSAPLGIILESDSHGYNTHAVDITKLEFNVSGINGINVLGLPFNIVKKKLMEMTYLN